MIRVSHAGSEIRITMSRPIPRDAIRATATSLLPKCETSGSIHNGGCRNELFRNLLSIPAGLEWRAPLRCRDSGLGPGFSGFATGPQDLIHSHLHLGHALEGLRGPRARSPRQQGIFESSHRPGQMEAVLSDRCNFVFAPHSCAVAAQSPSHRDDAPKVWNHIACAAGICRDGPIQQTGRHGRITVNSALCHSERVTCGYFAAGLDVVGRSSRPALSATEVGCSGRSGAGGHTQHGFEEEGKMI